MTTPMERNFTACVIAIFLATLAFCSGIYVGRTSVPNSEYELTLINQDSISLKAADTVYKIRIEDIQLTDKLQMPTEFEISQIRNKLFSVIKKATTP